MTNTLRIAFIKARWHAGIVDQAHAGFAEAMAQSGRPHTLDSFDVPGAFEMPLLARKLGRAAGTTPSSPPRWWWMVASTATTSLRAPW